MNMLYNVHKFFPGILMQHIDDPLLILTQIINNKEYYKKIMHHLEPQYFEFTLDNRIFKFINAYSAKYSEAPTPLIVQNALSRLELTDADHIQYINEFCDLINKKEIVPLEPLLDKTEEFIKDIELKLAITQAVSIYDGESKLQREAIPELVQSALSKTIEDSHGEFYFEAESALSRLEAYNNPESKIPFKIGVCNKVTNGGVTSKALHTFIGGPNVGKSSWLISLAADYIELGKNVLYVTCEMSQQQIGIRFDARFLNVETSEVPKMNSELYLSKLKKVQEKSGRLLIKEYAANEFTALQLSVLVDEIYTKYGFKPDVVCVDYLGICSSHMLKDRSNIGIYYTKVAEEFRACAQKKDFALWTAQQMVTDALDNTDPSLKHIGLGQGIAKTSDLVWFGIRTEELDALGQMLIKQ